MTLRLSQRTARIVGAVGRTLIGLGVITLLFVAYQLWGTGIQQARSQDRLSTEFAALLDATSDLRTTTTTTAPLPARGLGSSAPLAFPGVTTTTTTPSLPDPALLAALAPSAGEPIAHLRIPSIGVDETVVFGVGVPDLQKGPGLFPSNPLPGTPGNAAVAGHRTTWGQPFHDLDLVEPGDEIIVSTILGEFTYEVMSHDDAQGAAVGHFIVPETGVHVLDDYGDNRITLIACHPKFSSRQRIVVTGELVEDPVEPVTAPEPEPDDTDELGGTPSPTTTVPAADLPSEDWGEGLEGDTRALVPTLVWAGLFGLGLVAVWVVGQMWRRWPAYVLSTPLLAWLLWSWFIHLDRLLPSY